jgi:hypothetical protein
MPRDTLGIFLVMKLQKLFCYNTQKYISAVLLLILRGSQEIHRKEGKNMPGKLIIRIAEVQREVLQTNGIAVVCIEGKPFILMNEQGYPQAETVLPLLATTDFAQAIDWALDVEKDQREGLRAAGVAVVYDNGQPLILMNEEGYVAAQALLAEHDKRRAFVAALMPH